MFKKILLIITPILVVLAGVFILLRHNFQTKNICSLRLGFCSSVPEVWEVEDSKPNQDLKTLVSSFRCEDSDEDTPTDNANTYGSTDTSFSVLKLSSSSEIAQDDALSCLVNNCSNFSQLYTKEDKTIGSKSFIFITTKTDPAVTKIYLKSMDGYYAFYFDQNSFPTCGKKVDPESVLKKFLEDFSTKP